MPLFYGIDPKTMTDVLDEIMILFAKEPRPDHFTDYKHCEECADHNETLGRYDRYGIPLEQLNNPGWDPICFVKPEAFRYLFPRLCQLAYGKGREYYLDQFLFHLEYNIDSLTGEEKDKVYELLLDITAKNTTEIDTNRNMQDIDRISGKLTI